MGSSDPGSQARDCCLHISRAVQGGEYEACHKGDKLGPQEPQEADLMGGGCPITTSEQRPNDHLVNIL